MFLINSHNTGVLACIVRLAEALQWCWHTTTSVLLSRCCNNALCQEKHPVCVCLFVVSKPNWPAASFGAEAGRDGTHCVISEESQYATESWPASDALFTAVQSRWCHSAGVHVQCHGRQYFLLCYVDCRVNYDTRKPSRSIAHLCPSQKLCSMSTMALFLPASQVL